MFVIYYSELNLLNLYDDRLIICSQFFSYLMIKQIFSIFIIKMNQIGASKDCIEQSYKKLAFKWHPEKYTTTRNTQEALKVCH